MVRFKRHKYNAQPKIIDGIRFDSTTEANYYLILKDDSSVLHIDCHVPLTLVGGLRLNVDFLVYRQDETVEAIEIKGVETSEFKRMRKLFDSTHPLAPLNVFKKKGKQWVKL